VGPKADGSISDIQLDRLHKLGGWLDTNGEALFGSRPWVKASAKSSDGKDVRFTSGNGGLYVTYLSSLSGNTAVVPGIRPAPNTNVEILGSKGKAALSNRGNDILVTSDQPFPQTLAVSLKLTPPPQSAS
jgi:alpha-L-fucosidase